MAFFILKMNKKILVEFLGTFFLVSVVVGSGIMAENLSNGNDALALLGNTIATGAILYVLIKSFSFISGAHFNPAVSLVFYIRKELSLYDLYKYSIAQLLGGLLSILIVHYYFGVEIIQISTNIRGDRKQ